MRIPQKLEDRVLHVIEIYQNRKLFEDPTDYFMSTCNHFRFKNLKQIKRHFPKHFLDKLKEDIDFYEEEKKKGFPSIKKQKIKCGYELLEEEIKNRLSL